MSTNKQASPEGYPIPAGEFSLETTVVNSRFVCTIAPARSVELAQQALQRIKTAQFAASSHAFAYRIGFEPSVIDSCGDGGEPGGTAGRPMLAVLQGSGLGDTIAVVSRYFGGTKLGTGGLVRAFSGALQAALVGLPRTLRIERTDALFSLDYALFERAKLLIKRHNGEVLSEVFGADIAICARFPASDVQAFERGLSDLSAGKVKIKRQPVVD